MTPTLLFFAALVLGIIDEITSRGRSWLGWGLILVCIGLLWGTVFK